MSQGVFEFDQGELGVFEIRLGEVHMVLIDQHDIVDVVLGVGSF